MCGSIFSGWALTREQVVAETRKVASRLGCGEESVFSDAERLKSCLRRKSIPEVNDDLVYIHFIFCFHLIFPIYDWEIF